MGGMVEMIKSFIYCHIRLSALGPDMDMAIEDQLTVPHVAKFQPHSRAQYGTQYLCWLPAI